MNICNNVKIGDEFAGKKCNLRDFDGRTIIITNYLKCNSIKHPGSYYYKLQFIAKEGDKLSLYFTTCGAKQIVKILDMNPSIPIYKTIIYINRSLFFKENMASDEEVIKDIINTQQIDINKLK